jgi:hypothetical protein
MTTNTINNMFYIGKHSTCKLNDGYIGSGQKLKRAIREFGIKCFKCEIICFFDTAYEASLFENKLTKNCYGNPKCYNMEISAIIKNN